MTVPFTPDELQLLLGRSPRATLPEDIRASFAGARTLVTGAAGSIGSELARELAACAPERLALVDQSELGLFTLERELRARWPDVALDVCLLDVAREAAIARACRRLRPDVVYHAAAYKHVTMAERAPASAVEANVLGTIATASAAAEAGARFFLISSDKAADPTSVMGATKRLAEILTLAMSSPSFTPNVVRFGNVIASSGSVLQVMREAIRAGEPLRLTDPDATRFFMTAGEAVALVLRADTLGAAGRIFWLDMGDSIRMADIVSRLLAIETRAGFAPVPIEIIGLRPGEKQVEVLADPALVFERTLDDRIMVARETDVRVAARDQILARARRAAAHADDALALDLLSTAVPGFRPSEHAWASVGPREDRAA